MEYLITDIRTNKSTWIAADNARLALIAHENAWRTVKLPGTTKASDYSDAGAIDMSLGESVCRGFNENVMRETIGA